MSKASNRVAKRFIQAVRINRVPVSASVLNEFRRDLRRLDIHE